MTTYPHFEIHSETGPMFLKLTDYDNRPVLIPLDRIVVITPSDLFSNRTRITLDGGSSVATLNVKETASQIFDLIVGTDQ